MERLLRLSSPEGCTRPSLLEKLGQASSEVLLIAQPRDTIQAWVPSPIRKQKKKNTSKSQTPYHCPQAVHLLSCLPLPLHPPGHFSWSPCSDVAALFPDPRTSLELSSSDLLTPLPKRFFSRLLPFLHSSSLRGNVSHRELSCLPNPTQTRSLLCFLHCSGHQSSTPSTETLGSPRGQGPSIRHTASLVQGTEPDLGIQ